MNKLRRYNQLDYRLKRSVFSSIPAFQPYGYNISISHSHKFVWFRIAKNGTRSILAALDNADVSLDAKHPRLLKFPSARTSEYFVFCFVRNPWDRVVSAWQNKIVDNNLFNLDQQTRIKLTDFQQFVKYLDTELDINQTDIHLRPQSRLLDLENMDFIGKFETFEEDLYKILTNINVEVAEIPKNNSSNRISEYKTYYDATSRSIVGNLYSEDIISFGYEF